MACRVRCETGVASVESTPCFSLTGTGVAGNPLIGAPIIDPDALNIITCGPDGLFAEASAVVGEVSCISAVYQESFPLSGAPSVIASASSTIDNPTGRDMVGLFVFTLKANTNLRGSVHMDVLLGVQIDGGGYVDYVQELHGLTGAIALDPALGGDGTVNINGLNGVHDDRESCQTAATGTATGTFLGIPAVIAAGASHTIDIHLTGHNTGDPNWYESFAFWAGLVNWILVPA